MKYADKLNLSPSYFRNEISTDNAQQPNNGDNLFDLEILEQNWNGSGEIETNTFDLLK